MFQMICSNKLRQKLLQNFMNNVSRNAVIPLQTTAVLFKYKVATSLQPELINTGPEVFRQIGKIAVKCINLHS